MQTIQFNDNWVIVDGFHDNPSDVPDDDQQHTVEPDTPNWFWTGKRWSSQSARSKLFSSVHDAQSEMKRIRSSPSA